MPTLDVSDVLTSHEFMDKFTVVRRVETVGENGRASWVETRSDAFGVVTIGEPTMVTREDHSTYEQRVISVITRFRIQPPNGETKADVIEWAGGSYLVNKVDPYVRYGRGFVESTAVMLDPSAGLPLDLNTLPPAEF